MNSATRAQPLTKRATVTLRARDIAHLEDVATAAGVSKNDAIRKALATEAFVQKVIAEGGKVLVERDGEIREVVWP